MIHWLLQSTADHPDLVQGRAPVGLLSEIENKQLAKLKIKKRRQDWLLGRWTAKHLLQAYLEQELGTRLPLNAFTVTNQPDGAPFANLDLQPLPISLSISHSNQWAFCALSDATGVQIGADIELIEARSSHFVTDYFTETEIDQLERVSPLLRDTLITTIWSAKEATLKALRRGLTVSSRRISCSFSPSLQPFDNISDQGWYNLEIKCDPKLLPRTYDQSHGLTGWWCLIDGYILTLAALIQPELAMKD